MLVSSRLSCWIDSRKSVCLSGTFSIIISPPALDWGRSFEKDWIRGISKLFTLYVVATEARLEMEIGVVATFVTLHLSGLLGSHHYIPRGTPISTSRLRLNFSRGSMIRSNRDCGRRPLVRASTCTPVPPGSDGTALLRHKTQPSVPSSSHSVPSTLVGSSVPVRVGAGDFLSGRRLGGG